MNIAFFIEQHFDPEAGGVQRVTNSLSKTFSSRNQNIIIISYTDQKQESFKYNIPVFVVTNEPELQQVIEIEKIDVIINQVGYSVSFTNLLLRSITPETKLVNCLHINPLSFYDNYKDAIAISLKKRKLGYLNNIVTQKLLLGYHILKQRYELNYIIKNTNAFVMLSERFKPELYFLAPHLKKFDHKIFGISNPFERPELDVSKIDKENIILHVGRLNFTQKRVDLLMEIWKRLHSKLPDWEFWVVGDGPERKYMETFCNQNKMTRVKFWGQNKPDEFYKKAKIFHLTSAYEGFGNVLVEAQTYGCVPVLFNSYSAAEDIVTHNINGVLVKPFDIEEYVNETLKLIDDTEKLSAMSSNANRGVDKFSYEQTYLKWESVFETFSNETKIKIDQIL